jgi:hypothetical protein
MIEVIKVGGARRSLVCVARLYNTLVELSKHIVKPALIHSRTGEN